MSPAASLDRPNAAPLDRFVYHGQYSGVQILRFIAALLVVITHASLVVSERMPSLGSGVWEKGGIGVAMFFAISGFVIMVSGSPLRAQDDGWKIFAYRRLIRILPLYWVATTLKLGIMLLDPALTLHSGLNWWHVLMSYLLLPSRNPLGVITPIHAVGWTLVYEMFFYFTFSTALFFRLPPTRFVTAVFSMLIIWGVVNPEFSRNWSAFEYTDQIILEFLLGMLIAKSVESGFRPPPAVGLCCVIIGSMLIAHFDILTGWAGFLCHGVPSAIIVAGAVWLNPWLSRFNLSGPRFLGDSSYALYLFHPFVLGAAGVLLAKLRMTGAMLSIIIISSVAVICSAMFHAWFEMPLTGALKRLVRSRSEVTATQISLRS